MNRKQRRAARFAQEGAARPRDASGRVHLELYRDPTSGQPRVSLKQPVFAEQWQNDLVTAAASTALGTLEDAPSVARAAELARTAMEVTSGFVRNFLAQLPAGSVACQVGCAHCCHQVVTLTPPEVFAIVEHLTQSLSAAELARVTARVAEANERGRGLTGVERFSADHPCPFLEDNACSIYELRPLACRGMNSRDAAGCARNLQDPVARAAFLDDPRAGYSFAEPIRTFLAVSAGLQLALTEFYQLDMQPVELTAAVHLLLGAPKSLLSRWLAGDTPFESVRATEATSGAARRALGFE